MFCPGLQYICMKYARGGGGGGGGVKNNSRTMIILACIMWNITLDMLQYGFFFLS